MKVTPYMIQEKQIKFKVFRRCNSLYTPEKLRFMAIRAEKKALL